MDDWKFALPVGILLGTPMIVREWIIIDAEFQLTACFVLFVSTMYTQLGGMMGKSLDEYRDEIELKLRSVDDNIKTQLVSAIEAEKAALTMVEDMQEYNELKDTVKIAQAETLTNQEAHKYREAIVKKLDALSALEESASQAIRARMISQVQADVVSSFKNDRKAKDNALNQAIAVLAGGSNAKLGKDVVGELFSASLVNYKTAYAKLPAGSDEILIKLEEDMKAIASPPAVDGKGGNVYITHPI